MPSFYELLETSKEALKNEVSNFFETFTEAYYSPVNNRYSHIVIAGVGDYRWKELNEDAKQKQSDIYKKYNKLIQLYEVMLVEQPEKDVAKLHKIEKEVKDYILQGKQPWEKKVASVIAKVLNLIDEQFSLLNNINFTEEGLDIYVPDTNALLINYNLENWYFSKTEKFIIVLLPTVLAELDRLKIAHQNRELKEKAGKIITRIKEYRRRGTLTEGVTINKKISLKAIALEPDFKRSLNWLDSDNNDDRIIASFLEVCRRNIRNSVYLVTSDINLQNKAEFANIPYSEPPEDVQAD